MTIHVPLLIAAAFLFLLGPMLYFTWLGMGEPVHRPGEGGAGGDDSTA